MKVPTMTFRLAEEKLDLLRQMAAAQNRTTDALVEEAIDAYLPRKEKPSLADVLQDYIGAIDGPATDSSRIGEVFGDVLKQKQTESHL